MKRLYVLVRTDLTGSSSAVQAGHAVAQFMIEHPTEWNNSYLIYLGVDSKIELDKWAYKLYNRGRQSRFKEPDLDNEVTAIAVSGVEQKFFKKLKLL